MPAVCIDLCVCVCVCSCVHRCSFISFVRLNEFFRPFGGLIVFCCCYFVFVAVLPSSVAFGAVFGVYSMCDEREREREHFASV